MTAGKRPGGLTALAVINFVFGGFGALGLLAMAALMAIIGAAANSGEESGDAAMQEMAAAWEEIGLGVFYAMLALSAISTVLLIVSGVGYLQQKKFLGRTMGNAYALLAVVSSVITGLVVSVDAGGGFNIGTIIGLVYPVLTLLLLNTTFKEDFVN